MTAVAGASGMRMWLEARVPLLARPRIRTGVRRTIVIGGVLAAGLVGPAAHGSAGPQDRAGSAASPPPATVARAR